MLGWLRGKKVSETTEVWSSTEQKFQGILDEVRKRRTLDAGVVLVAHFPDTLKQVEALLHSEEIPFESFDSPPLIGRQFETNAFEAKIFVVLSRYLKRLSGTVGKQDRDRSVSVLMVEAHPIPDYDQYILRYAQRLPFQRYLIKHVSFDEPILKLFGGDELLPVLEKLGFDRNESVGSAMIGNAITQAQKKIAKKAGTDREADSVGEWIEINCPGMQL